MNWGWINPLFPAGEVPFGRDGDFVRTSMIQRINSDLANDIGNLSQRTLSLVFKNLDGRLPELPAELTAEDTALLNAADGLLASVRTAMTSRPFMRLCGKSGM